MVYALITQMSDECVNTHTHAHVCVCVCVCVYNSFIIDIEHYLIISQNLVTERASDNNKPLQHVYVYNFLNIWWSTEDVKFAVVLDSCDQWF